MLGMHSAAAGLVRWATQAGPQRTSRKISHRGIESAFFARDSDGGDAGPLRWDRDEIAVEEVIRVAAVVVPGVRLRNFNPAKLRPVTDPQVPAQHVGRCLAANCPDVPRVDHVGVGGIVTEPFEVHERIDPEADGGSDGLTRHNTPRHDSLVEGQQAKVEDPTAFIHMDDTTDSVVPIIVQACG
jgi:hypothetical protein